MSMKDQIQKRADAIGKEYAYPFFEQYTNGVSNFGLTKFELFAAMAMQGIISSDTKGEFSTTSVCQSSVTYAKELCYTLAQAELEGGQNG